MKEVKYIPGDLVKASNNPNIVWIIKNVSQDKRGNVLYEVIAAEENDAFIYLYEHQIAPIPLTKEILDKNDLFIRFSKDEYHIYAGESEVYIYDVHGNGEFEVTSAEYTTIAKLQYVHQLQHLLFGLGLNSELKV